MNIETIYHKFNKVKKISTDTRKEVKGTIFFALGGENFDGNQYAEDALRKGAAFVVVDKDLSIENDRVIRVDSVLKCLQQLARKHRESFNFPVLGITGSNGKTTTKELIVAVLSVNKKVAFTRGNFNNHIGVPLTILSIVDPVDIAVIEMGANHVGEIWELCAICNPDFGIITNIGQAHLEGFGSFENIISTKQGLYRWIIEKEGLIFFNDQDNLLKSLIEDYSNKVAYNPEALEVVSSFPSLHLSFSSQEIFTQLIGNYNIPNIAAAMTIGAYFGLEVSDIQKGLKEYQPSNNRSQLFEIGNITFVLDSYNANPDSMKSSIESFAKLNTNKEKVMILGDMFELGSYSKDAHQEIIHRTQELKGIQSAFIGNEFYLFQSSENSKDVYFENLENFHSKYDFDQLDGKIVLLKGSRGVGLERILLHLQKESDI